MLERRTFMAGVAGLAFAETSPPARPSAIAKKLVLNTGDSLPVIGMGTWLTFNISTDGPDMTDRKAVSSWPVL